jgi:hypothetical protein
MAFLKGVSTEDMEVRVMSPEDFSQSYIKPWARGVLKQIQAEFRLEDFGTLDEYDPLG